MQKYSISQTSSRTSINHVRREIEGLRVVINLAEISHCYAMARALNVGKSRALRVVHLVVHYGGVERVGVEVLHPDKQPPSPVGQLLNRHPCRQVPA